MDNKLQDLRQQIDMLDNQLLEVLSNRMKVVEQIGELKKDQGRSPLDEERWQEVILNRIAKAKSLNLSEDFINKLFDLIHQYALEIESKK